MDVKAQPQAILVFLGHKKGQAGPPWSCYLSLYHHIILLNHTTNLIKYFMIIKLSNFERWIVK